MDKILLVVAIISCLTGLYIIHYKAEVLKKEDWVCIKQLPTSDTMPQEFKCSMYKLKEGE